MRFDEDTFSVFFFGLFVWLFLLFTKNRAALPWTKNDLSYLMILSGCTTQKVISVNPSALIYKYAYVASRYSVCCSFGCWFLGRSNRHVKSAAVFQQLTSAYHLSQPCKTPQSVTLTSRKCMTEFQSCLVVSVRGGETLAYPLHKIALQSPCYCGSLVLTRAMTLESVKQDEWYISSSFREIASHGGA